LAPSSSAELKNILVLWFQIHSSGTPVGTAVMDDKGCYRLDVGPAFSYNYVVNPTVLSTTAYKCDVCGLAFAHPTLLSQHKRLHTQSVRTYKMRVPCISSIEVWLF